MVEEILTVNALVATLFADVVIHIIALIVGFYIALAFVSAVMKAFVNRD